MLVPMVDTIFSDVAQPDQARIVAINAQYFLKVGGHFVISIKVGIFVLHEKIITVTKKNTICKVWQCSECI